MPDTRKHRGPHPEDTELFAAPVVPRLRSAVEDLSWLLGRGYAEPSALELVGNRYQLRDRQRTAVRRSSCSDAARAGRAARRKPLAAARGARVAVDGYNLLVTVESGLGGGVILRGRDGVCRDLASLHGSYRRVEETRPAAVAIGRELAAAGPAAVHWLLDAPVSSSGRLAGMLRRLAAAEGWPWTVEIHPDPDAVLESCGDLVATSDSRVLDAPVAWLPLGESVLASYVPRAWLVDLAPGAAAGPEGAGAASGDPSGGDRRGR